MVLPNNGNKVIHKTACHGDVFVKSVSCRLFDRAEALSHWIEPFAQSDGITMDFCMISLSLTSTFFVYFLVVFYTFDMLIHLLFYFCCVTFQSALF